MTTAEPSLSAGRPAATEPAGRGLPGLAAWLPTWDLITTKNLEIRTRRGLMITMVVLIVAPSVTAAMKPSPEIRLLTREKRSGLPAGP